MSAKIDIAKKYFKAFTSGDIDGVLSCWTSDGIVNFEGPAPATQFYPGSADFVSTLSFNLQKAYLSEDGENVVLQFSYKMPTEDGGVKETQGADIIEFTSDNKISKLTVLHN